MIKEGDEIEFTCNVSGKPSPKIHWKKDGKVLSTENTKHLRFESLVVINKTTQCEAMGPGASPQDPLIADHYDDTTCSREASKMFKIPSGLE